MMKLLSKKAINMLRRKIHCYPDRPDSQKMLPHMNGQNTEQYNYGAEKVVNSHIASDLRHKMAMHKDDSSSFDPKNNPKDKALADKLRQAMDRRGFTEADAIRHVIDRDRGEKLAQQPKPEPLLHARKEDRELLKFNKLGQWELCALTVEKPSTTNK